MTLFEVCVDSAEGARAARDAGAHRVELCCALLEGGLTPSPGLLGTTLETAPGIEVNVLIRPRGGDFVYDAREVRAMVSDIATASAMGAHGVVIGALTADGDVDMGICRELVDAAAGLSVTFHRAFDMARDPFAALESLVELGADLVLTSGQEASALQGAPLLAQLVEAAGNRIRIMPGAGVTRHNARRILDLTGARDLHFSASATEDGPMRHRNPRPAMGGRLRGDEFARRVTSVTEIRAIVAAVGGSTSPCTQRG